MNSQLSPRGAVAMGLLFILCGVLPILMGLGIITPTDQTGSPPPAWVPVAAGLVFVAAGLAVILDFGVAVGMDPQGDFEAGTSMGIRATSLILTLTILGLFAAVAGWIAFGSGPRAFTSTLSMPFLESRWQSSELAGRVAFGAGAVFMVLMFLACGIKGVHRLWTMSHG